MNYLGRLRWQTPVGTSELGWGTNPSSTHGPSHDLHVYVIAHVWPLILVVPILPLISVLYWTYIDNILIIIIIRVIK